MSAGVGLALFILAISILVAVMPMRGWGWNASGVSEGIPGRTFHAPWYLRFLATFLSLGTLWFVFKWDDWPNRHALLAWLGGISLGIGLLCFGWMLSRLYRRGT